VLDADTVAAAVLATHLVRCMLAKREAFDRAVPEVVAEMESRNSACYLSFAREHVQLKVQQGNNGNVRSGAHAPFHDCRQRHDMH
jgi:rRNA maturation endonuclease Nob1